MQICDDGLADLPQSFFTDGKLVEQWSTTYTDRPCDKIAYKVHFYRSKKFFFLSVAEHLITMLLNSNIFSKT